MAADNAVALDAILQVFDEYGGWDSIYPGTYTPLQLQALGANPMRYGYPAETCPMTTCGNWRREKSFSLRTTTGSVRWGSIASTRRTTWRASAI